MANTLKFGNSEWYGSEGNILAYNDLGGNYKPLPFSFSRGSSATRVNQQGLIETVGANDARVDYLDNAKGALKLEPSRTNLITQSEAFDNSYWTKSGASVVGGFASPSADSPLGAYKLVSTSSNGQIQAAIGTGVVGSNYVGSIYVKRIKGNGLIYIRNINGSTIPINTTNEWQRFEASATASGTTLRVGLNIETIGDEVMIFGGQLEAGSYATSIIKTEGTVQTRLADSCSQTPPDGVIGQTEGTMFFEIDFKNTSGVSGAWSISNASTANRITMNTTNLSSTQFTLSVAQNYNSGSTKLASSNVTFSDKHKVAIKYSGTTLKLFVDGQLSDSVSTDGFGNYTNFYVGGNQNGVGGDARKFIQANLYNTALSDSELAALTQV